MNHLAREQQRLKLSAWLAERALDQPLADDSLSIPLRRAARYDETAATPRLGEVYLLRPALVTRGPVYVLIVESCADGWRMIPFGRYATPAVPGEWATGLDAAPLRVLCGWNARVVPTDALLPGMVKKLTPRSFAEIRSMMQSIASSVAITDEKAGSFGPPLVHPADPRYEYLDEEHQRLNDHVPEPDRGVDGNDGVSSRWLLAAEGRLRYGEPE